MLKKIFKHLTSGTLIPAIKGRIRAEEYKRSLRRWKRVTREKGHIFYTFDNDIKLKLYSDSVLSRVIYDGHFEEEELSYYRKYIKEGFTVLDIGANIGLHALYASKLTGINGRVFAFEPVLKTYNRLIENVELNKFKNIEHFKLAISDANGESKIMTSLDGHDAWNSMANTSHGANVIEEVIETQTLDFFISQKIVDKKIDFIKIDTEGWERNVLSGAENYLKNNCPVLMVEYAEDILKQFGRKLEDIYDKLTEYGYGIYKYDHKKDSFRLVNRDEKFGEANIFASKSRL